MKTITILGGGISGLAAAYYARNLGLHVTVLEAEASLGGCVSTRRVDGCLLEGGPDSLISYKPAALELCRQVGLQEMQPAGRSSALVLKGGQLHPLPDGFRQLAPGKLVPFLRSPLLSPWGKLRACMEPLIPRERRSDPTLAQFVRSRLGQEVLDWLAQPLVAGIFASDPERLSLRATFPQFLGQRSLMLSMLRSNRRATGSPFFAPKEGMGSVIERLAEQAHERITGVRVEALQRQESGWTMHCSDGVRTSDLVLLAVPAPEAARLLADLAPGVGQLRSSSTATLNLVWNAARLPDASGFVVPLREDELVSACTFSDQKYPGRARDDRRILRLHLGGAGREESLRQDDSRLVDSALARLRPWLGLRGEPLAMHLVRHHQRMPEYAVGHLERVATWRRQVQRHPGLAVAGNWLDGVGLADCVRVARQAVEGLVSSNPPGPTANPGSSDRSAEAPQNGVPRGGAGNPAGDHSRPLPTSPR